MNFIEIDKKREEVLKMSKKIIYLVITIVLCFLSIRCTSAYFNTNTNVGNSFKTKKYSISFDATDGVYDQSCVGISNEIVALPVPYKEDYGLIGYSTTPNGEVEYSDIFNININDVDGKKLYPVYMCLYCDAEYEITYDLNGGFYWSADDMVFSYTSETPTFTITNPSHASGTFLGWSVNGSDVLQETVTIEQGSTGDIHLKAYWSEDEPVVDNTRLFYILAPDFATYDIYLYGNLIEDDYAGTFMAYIEKGTPYEIKDIKADYGLSLTSHDGDLSGSISDTGTIINLYFG